MGDAPFNDLLEYVLGSANPWGFFCAPQRGRGVRGVVSSEGAAWPLREEEPCLFDR